MNPATLRARYGLTPAADGYTLHALTVLAPCLVREAAEACGIKPATAFQRIQRARHSPNAKADLPPPETASTNQSRSTAVQSSDLLGGLNVGEKS
jgi:rubredoxin